MTELCGAHSGALLWIAARAVRGVLREKRPPYRNGELVVGTLALRLHAERPLVAVRRRARGRLERGAGGRAGAVRRADSACGAALERVGDAAGRAAVRRERLQSVRLQWRGRARDRAIHAGYGQGV